VAAVDVEVGAWCERSTGKGGLERNPLVHDDSPHRPEAVFLMIASLSSLIWGVGTSLTTILYGSTMTAAFEVAGSELEAVMVGG
jgi:hypothetical protein